MVPIQRGDVVLVDLPYIQEFSRSKKRPVLVIQNDIGNRFSTNTIVLAISSRPPKIIRPITESSPIHPLVVLLV